MASRTENTFGARLYNAEQLSTNLATFAGYVPLTPETSVAAYNTLITAIEDVNAQVAAAHSQFSLAVDNRQYLFMKSETSLFKTMSPILSYVKAKFGKKSEQAAEITTLVNNIRGEKTAKLKRDEEGEFVSQSHRSYGSQTQYFADIITILNSYGAAYAPTNTSITTENLTLQLEALTAANTQVTTAYSTLKPLQDMRLNEYSPLSSRSQTIKDAVKSQYGIQSSEYKLIKGYKI